MSFSLLGGSPVMSFSYACTSSAPVALPRTMTHLEVLDRLDGELHLDLLKVTRCLGVEC